MSDLNGYSTNQAMHTDLRSTTFCLPQVIAKRHSPQQRSMEVKNETWRPASVELQSNNRSIDPFNSLPRALGDGLLDMLANLVQKASVGIPHLVEESSIQAQLTFTVEMKTAFHGQPPES